MGRSVMISALRVLRSVVLGYVIATLAASYFAPGLLYPFMDRPFTDGRFARHEVPARDGVPLDVAVHDAGDASPVVLVFVGNAGSREAFRGFWEVLIAGGVTVVAAPYRGAEGAPGGLGEDFFKADALAVHDAVPGLLGRDVPELVVLGYSLGSGLAVHVAAERAVAGVALLAPFDRMCRVAEQRVWMPACLIPWVDHWNSVARVPELNAPVWVAHGLGDEMIRPVRAQVLSEALAGEGRLGGLVVAPEAGHDILQSKAVRAAMVGWLRGGWRSPPAITSDQVVKGFAHTPDV